LINDNDQSIDVETRCIFKLLQTLDSIKGNVQYSLFTIAGDDETEITLPRHFCMVQVLHDTTFFKFPKQKRPGSMILFRGSHHPSSTTTTTTENMSRYM
jgi:hypothetical protein